MPRKGIEPTKVGAGRLKVFQAQFGFYDSVVAAPSQAAALRAWGTHQNLFADGQARVATDKAAVEAALSHPNTPLRRALGSQSAFAVEPTSLPVVPDLPKSAGRKRAPAPPRAPVRPKPPADRSELDAAERTAARLEEEREDENRAFARRQSELDAAIAAARKRYEHRRKTVGAAVAAARDAYRKAGGSP